MGSVCCHKQAQQQKAIKYVKYSFQFVTLEPECWLWFQGRVCEILFFFSSLNNSFKYFVFLKSTVFGAGHVMPICRGAGVDQLDLIRFSRRLAAGSVSPQWSCCGGLVNFNLIIVIHFYAGHGATYFRRVKRVTFLLLLTSAGDHSICVALC